MPNPAANAGIRPAGLIETLGKSDNMIREEIRKLEDKLVTPAARMCADTLDRLVSDHFVEFGSSGRIYTKPGVIAQMLAKPHITASLTDFRVLALSPDVALATY